MGMHRRRRTQQRSVQVVGIVLAAVILAASQPSVAIGGASPPPVHATASVLVDVKTGQVLFAHAPHLRWRPASTTKMLTALLVVEALADDQEVPISARAARQRSGRAIGLEVGERWRAGDLLRAMLLHSANDAAIALAEAVSGSVEGFADRMNAKAKALGAVESHFVVPHGLDDPQHYSTAYDLALIARAALQKQRIAEVVRLRTWDLVRPGQPTRMVVNSNRLLWRYPDADGVKTGWIPQSGLCLVASATRDGRQLIAVVLDDKRPYTDAVALLDYGFTNFTLAKVTEAGEVMATMPVANGREPLVAIVPHNVFAVTHLGAAIVHEVVLTKDIAPLPQGAVVGRVVYTSDGEEVAWAWLVAQDPVPTVSMWTRVFSWVSKAFAQWL